MFGGSLSFINGDQIVQLLRAVAANAKGYAFQIALDTVYPEGSKWIENFQKKIQELNQYMGNSCQLAQGIVDGGIDAVQSFFKSDADNAATGKGLFSDIFSANQETEGEKSLTQLKKNAQEEYKELVGNVIWKELKKNRVSNWFTYGDDEMLESMMSLTGTIIIGEPQDNGEDGDAAEPPVITLPGNKISLSDFINGGRINIYSCDGDKELCMDAGESNKNINIDGINARILKILLGDSTRQGIIYKFATNSGELTDEEKAFVSSLPSGMGAIVRNLSLLSPDSAKIFVNRSSRAIALSMVYSFVEDFFHATQIAISTSKSPYLQKVIDLINQSLQQMRSERATLESEYGKLVDQIDHYNTILNNTRKNKYMLEQLMTKANTKD